MLKIAVIGSNGMLGADFMEAASECEDITASGFDLPDFDIRSASDVRRAVASSDAVANFAAYTDVESAESHRDLCFSVNADGAGLLAIECAASGKYLLHVSTDFVFGDKTSAPLKEDDRPCPLNVYDESKLEGERRVLDSGAEAAILRLEWTYGRNGKNFVSKVISAALKGEELSIPDDQIGSPTWTLEASYAILSLIRKKARGVFHFAPIGYASRFDVAKFALEEAGIEARMRPRRSSDSKTAARRPLNSCFDCSKIEALIERPRRDWREALAEFIAVVYKQKVAG